jgi:hypothetical protein
MKQENWELMEQKKMDIEWLKINKYWRLLKLLTLLSQKGQGGMVNIANRLQTGRSEIQIPIVVRDFSLLFNVQTGSDAQQFSYSIGIEGLQLLGA